MAANQTGPKDPASEGTSSGNASTSSRDARKHDQEEKGKGSTSLPQNEIRNERILWVTADNAKVNKVMHGLMSRCPDRRIIKVYPYDAELCNLMSPEPLRPTALNLSPAAPQWAQELAEQFDQLRLKDHNEKSPATNENSWSEFCRRTVLATPASFPKMIEAWNVRKSDPTSFLTSRPLYLNDARQTLEQVLEQVDAIVTTPLNLRAIARRVTWKPTIIIIDDTDKMTEAEGLLPLSLYPDVPTLNLGDIAKAGQRMMRQAEAAGIIDFGPAR